MAVALDADEHPAVSLEDAAHPFAGDALHRSIF